MPNLFYHFTKTTLFNFKVCFLFISTFVISLAQANLIAPSVYLQEPLGTRHIRLEQISQYVETISAGNQHIKRIKMGMSHEKRPLYLYAISNKNNIKRLDELRVRHEQLANPAAAMPQIKDMPAFIWLGYTAHGDEASGAHSAVQLIYDLLARDDLETYLNHAVIFIEPVINPDGYARYSTWANSQASLIPNSDSQHIEHHQNWLTGRGNHYWFDLNRDWIPLTQPETQARLRYFHYFRPNVLADFHEMESDQTYFFQPGAQDGNNPLTPKKNQDLTLALTQHAALAFDQRKQVYFTQEKFDDFYYGKASSYPDIQGSIGVLFEQSTPAGQVIKSKNGEVSLFDAISNHLTASHALINGSIKNRLALLQYQRDYFKQAREHAKDDDITGYLLRSDNKYALEKLLNLLKKHQIKTYKLTQDHRISTNKFKTTNTVWLPLDQDQYTLIKSVLSTQTQFKQNHFYDITNWNLALSHHVDAIAVKSRFHGIKSQNTPWHAFSSEPELNTIQKNDFAWVLDWQAPHMPTVINALLQNNHHLKVAYQAFTVNKKEYPAGSIVILSGHQPDVKGLQNDLIQLQQTYQFNITSLSSAITQQGSDLGSHLFKNLRPMKAAILVGHDLDLYSTGEIWQHFDQQLKAPLTKLNHQQLIHFDLRPYSHLILPDGYYLSWSPEKLDTIKNWVKQGGVLITLQRAAEWAANHQLISNAFLSRKDIQLHFENSKLQYADQADFFQQMQITGTVFEATTDRSHSLTFGYEDTNIAILKNRQLIMEESPHPFKDALFFAKNTLLAGYAHEKNQKLINNSIGLTAHSYGQGLVIANTDNYLFRGYWHGTEKLFDNLLFMSPSLLE